MADRNVTVMLSNSFHGTSARVRVPESWADNAWIEMQAAAQNDQAWRDKVRRVARKLCGSSDCTCGNVRN